MSGTYGPERVGRTAGRYGPFEVVACGRVGKVAYESFDPGDPGKWVLRLDGEPVAANTRLLSTDSEGAALWATETLESMLTR